jgi:hypothetical protein
MFVAARTMRLVSIAACLITIASFAMFAVGQTSSASVHQQSVLSGETPLPSPETGGPAQPTPGPAQPAGSTKPGGSGSSTSRDDSAHKVIDEASNALTSPFSGVTAGWSSQWTIRGAKLLLALALYGFAFGFVARMFMARV